jgi:hypothetical protein
MMGSAWGSLLVSGLAGFFAGSIVLWLARGSWAARVSVGVLTAACFIASAIAVKVAFQAAHSDGPGGLFLFIIGIYGAAVGVGLLGSIFLPVQRSPK